MIEQQCLKIVSKIAKKTTNQKFRIGKLWKMHLYGTINFWIILIFRINKMQIIVTLKYTILCGLHFGCYVGYWQFCNFLNGNYPWKIKLSKLVSTVWFLLHCSAIKDKRNIHKYINRPWLFMPVTEAREILPVIFKIVN